MDVSRTLNITVRSILVLLIGSAVLVILYTSITTGWLHPHPSDEALIHALDENTEDYNMLVTMFSEDTSLTAVATKWMHPENAITNTRRERYRTIFQRLKLAQGIRRGPGNAIRFISSSKGLAINGSTKGLIYEPEKPEPLFNSLDEVPSPDELSGTGYRRINDKWYIFFEYHP